ncbi:MAG TPA: GNAT family N-acetyltransferase [Prosthecobacter sp.]|nr:GNAT family N-acetyltransferase [Prosthecobacter sp.]
MVVDPRAVFELNLEDGTPVLLRALTPADRDGISEAFARLSPEARYFRFWTRFRELNPRFIEELCSPDQKDHVAWAVLHREREDIPGIGGGSFWRLKDDPAAAEVSFTVADEFQGKGVGTLVLAMLWLHAETLGIRKFVGHVLNENLSMRAWWDALGATAEERQRHWVMTLLLDETLLQDTSAGRELRERLRALRAMMG